MIQQTVLVHTFNPSTWEAETDLCEFKTSLVYNTVSSRTARATKKNPVLNPPPTKRF